MELSFLKHGDGCKPHTPCMMCKLRIRIEDRPRAFSMSTNFISFEKEVGKTTFSPDTHRAECTPNDPCGNCKGWRFLLGKLDLTEEDLNKIFFPESVPSPTPPGPEEEAARVRAIRLDTLDLSIRAKNSLRNDHIDTIGDVLKKTEGELLEVPDFGRKSLVELKAALYEIGRLYPGMDLPK